MVIIASMIMIMIIFFTFNSHLLDALYEQERSVNIPCNTSEPMDVLKSKMEDEEMGDIDEVAIVVDPQLVDTSGFKRWTTEEDLTENGALQRKTQSLADFTQGKYYSMFFNVIKFKRAAL